ncbi:MAG: D-alanine--D-alanine ligase [Spirochaetales bacterium]|nr:D-alanine--D-alanine ligase [Spirochaetales bacterium]
MKKTVCILYGGRSQEHEVSRQSAASVYRHLNREKYVVMCIGLDRDGTWHYRETPAVDADPVRGDMLRISPEADTVSLVPGKGFFVGTGRLPIDFVFPVLHGTFGEDGTLQGLLEMMNLPYAGAGVLGSALSMDKEKAKTIWRERGLPVVDSVTVRKDEFETMPTGRDAALAAGGRLGFPLFVKPVGAGSSVGVSKVMNADELPAALAAAFLFDDRALVERAVEAREIECAVIGNERPRAFPPGEIVPRLEYYSYEAKYLDPEGARLSIPADIDESVSLEARNLAIEAYSSLSAEGFARVDLFLDKADGRLYLNEINSIPGFTNISMFPRLCAAGGLPYGALLDAIIEYGFNRHARRSAVSFDFARPSPEPRSSAS